MNASKYRLIAFLMLVAAFVAGCVNQGLAAHAGAASVSERGAQYQEQTPRAGLPPFWHSTPAAWCQEDMPCWIGSASDDRSDAASYAVWVFEMRHAHDTDFVPRWLSCNTIDGSEFPRKADRAWHICYRNINRLHSHWRFVGPYDGKSQVWVILGYTSVYVTRAGWFETS